MIKNINNIVKYPEIYIYLSISIVSGPLASSCWWYNPFIFCCIFWFHNTIHYDCCWEILKRYWVCVLLTSICQSIPLICSPVISLTSAQYILEIYSLHILDKITQKAFTYLYWQTPSPRWPFQLIEMGHTCSSLAGWHIIWRQSLLGGGGSSIRYAVKHMHIYWPNPRLWHTSGFPRHTIHTHSQPIGRADKYQEQKRQ